MLAVVALALYLATFPGRAYARPFNITNLIVPATVLPGQQEVEIECQYDANFTLLSWFKGPNEFFRYRPGSAPSTRSFPIIGVGTVELIVCGPTACRLKLGSLTEEAEGLYRCDIERDVPPYKFETRTAYMSVNGHEHRRPLLEGLAAEYGEGDTLQAYCRGAPDSELRWYINGREIDDVRGSPKLKYKSTRLIFLGLPPTVTVQCAEFRFGKIYGSKELKARWDEVGHFRKNDTKPKKNSASVNLGHLSIISIVIYILY